MQSAVSTTLWLRYSAINSRLFHTSVVCERYKKKWVEMGRKKVLPRELALAYFDAYYPQVYGEKCWEQARLAMLRKKKKYCALVNNYANSKDIVAELISEHHAYDIFTVAGNPLKVPRRKHNQRINYDDITTETSNKWEEMAVDLADSKPDKTMHVEYVETPEGFMVPKNSENTPSHYHPPDLYDYVPAERKITEKEQMEGELERQSLLLGVNPGVDIIPSDPLLVPPMLKCHVHETGVVKLFHNPRQDETKLLNYYLMDGASILPVLALDIRPNDRILDICAAPGGKSLAMAQCLIADQIVCVDSSHSRLSRLRDTIRWYIPGVFDDMDQIKQPVVILHDDGRALGDKHPDRYDKVLVDVPCNTDRKCLNEDENNRFKRTRVTERLQLPQLQAELLMSGIKACRPGGAVVYSTCTLTPGQNDYVVEAAITQLRHTHSDIQVVVQDTSSIRDRLSHVFKFWPGSRYGQVVLPTAEANFGPGYFAKILRVK